MDLLWIIFNWHNQAVGDDRQVLAVDSDTCKDGAVTQVDGRLFHTRIHQPKKSQYDKQT